MKTTILVLLCVMSCYAGQLETAQTNLNGWIKNRNDYQSQLTEKQKQLESTNKDLIANQKNVGKQKAVTSASGKRHYVSDTWAQQKVNDLTLKVVSLNREIQQLNQYILYANNQINIWSNQVNKLTVVEIPKPAITNKIEEIKTKVIVPVVTNTIVAPVTPVTVVTNVINKTEEIPTKKVIEKEGIPFGFWVIAGIVILIWLWKWS